MNYNVGGSNFMYYIYYLRWNKAERVYQKNLQVTLQLYCSQQSILNYVECLSIDVSTVKATAIY